MEIKIHYTQCECTGCVTIQECGSYEPCDCEHYKYCYGEEAGIKHYLQYPGQAPYLLLNHMYDPDYDV